MNSRFYLVDPNRGASRLIGLTLAVAMGACTNIKNDSTRTRTEGGLAGAAGGALVGVGAGALLGGKDKKKAMLAGAAAGALVGAAAGVAHGDAVAKKKEGYTATEDSLDARIRTAKRQLADRHTFNNGLQYEIARHQARLASIQAGSATGRAVEEFELRSTVTKRVGELDRQERSWQQTIDEHKAALRTAGRDPRAATLRSDINALAAEQSQLVRQRKELLSITRRAR